MNPTPTVELFYTGFCLASESIAMKNRRQKQIRFHANCALIKHPTKGNILFDTGYATRFYSATKKWPEKIQALATPSTIAESWNIVEQLAAQGITHKDIKHLVISHYHADHICGLKDFPSSKLYSERSAFEQIDGLSRFAAVRRGLIQKLLPDDLEERLSFFDSLKKVTRKDDFGFHYDFFGDASIKVVQLPGHARGQIGLIINEGMENHVFLAADGFWLSKSLVENVLPSSLTRLFFDDWKAYKATFEKIRQYKATYPDCTLISCHCPDIFDKTDKKPYS